MAGVTSKQIVTINYTLTMDPEEAGYLYDLMMAHVAGDLVDHHEPLGRIITALNHSSIQRIYAHNVNPNPTHKIAILNRNGVK